MNDEAKEKAVRDQWAVVAGAYLTTAETQGVLWGAAGFALKWKPTDPRRQCLDKYLGFLFATVAHWEGQDRMYMAKHAVPEPPRTELWGITHAASVAMHQTYGRLPLEGTPRYLAPPSPETTNIVNDTINTFRYYMGAVLRGEQPAIDSVWPEE